MNDDLHTTDISSGALRRGLRISVTSSALGLVYFAVILNMPFVMLLEALGASGFLIGLYGTLRQLALLMQIPGSLMMESLKRRKPAWATLGVIHRLLLLIPAWLAWRHGAASFGADLWRSRRLSRPAHSTRRPPSPSAWPKRWHARIMALSGRIRPPDSSPRFDGAIRASRRASGIWRYWMAPSHATMPAARSRPRMNCWNSSSRCMWLPPGSAG